MNIILKNGTRFYRDSYQSDRLASCRYRPGRQKRAVSCLFDVTQPCGSRVPRRIISIFLLPLFVKNTRWDRISSGSALLSQIHVDRIGPGTDNINTYIDNFTEEKTPHGSRFKKRQWRQYRFRIISVKVSMFMMGIAFYSSSG